MRADHRTSHLSRTNGRCIHFWFISSVSAQHSSHHNDFLVFSGQLSRVSLVYVTNTEVSNPGNSRRGHMKDDLYISLPCLYPAAQLPSVCLTSMLPLVYLRPSRWNSCQYQTTPAKSYNFFFSSLKWNFSKKVIQPTSLMMAKYPNNLIYIYIYLCVCIYICTKYVSKTMAWVNTCVCNVWFHFTLLDLVPLGLMQRLFSPDYSQLLKWPLRTQASWELLCISLDLNQAHTESKL